MAEDAVPTLAEFLQDRRFPLEAVAVLTGLSESAVSRIARGLARPRAVTIVQLASGLGVGARRMKAMCDASWQAAHSDETAVR